MTIEMCENNPIDTNDGITYRVELSDMVTIPSNYEPKKILTASDLDQKMTTVGWTLPNGQIIRPVISYELSDETEENYYDMTYQQLCDLGILSGDDLSTTIHEVD